MSDQILLNHEMYHMSEAGLPCLIHYAPHAGGSHFSVALVADFFLKESKILILTAYPMAKDNFMRQIKGEESKTAYITDESQFSTDAQAIILESGNEELFLKAVAKLSDLDDRVVLVKNMEVFSDAVFDACLRLRKIILSGNVDACPLKKQISEKEYHTMVLFSKSETPLRVEPPVLEKYSGYLWSNEKEGIVSVQMEQRSE